MLVLPGPAGCSVTTTWELWLVLGEARAGATGGAFAGANCTDFCVRHVSPRTVAVPPEIEAGPVPGAPSTLPTWAAAWLRCRCPCLCPPAHMAHRPMWHELGGTSSSSWHQARISVRGWETFQLFCL